MLENLYLFFFLSGPSLLPSGHSTVAINHTTAQRFGLPGNFRWACGMHFLPETGPLNLSPPPSHALYLALLHIPSALCSKPQFPHLSMKQDGPHHAQLTRVGCTSVVSDSVRPPHGLQPARLLCPWDSPGKNTGVACHFLLH